MEMKDTNHRLKMMTNNGNGNSVSSFFQRNAQNIIFVCGLLISGSYALSRLEARVINNENTIKHITAVNEDNSKEKTNLQQDIVVIKDKLKTVENQLKHAVAREEVAVLKSQTLDTLKEIDTIYLYAMNGIKEEKAIRKEIGLLQEKLANLKGRIEVSHNNGHHK